ncbi:hypothetical protein B296_00021382 [Ensete ventricosum]|uniref:Uncharacterized protein n=1 Tax=Ensete ventricosum TaxID=4639 RepID=A0A427AXG4_ENSVE|nr:hypothetical protein B296_00021382 [Ensete ventricosum]
MTFLDQMTLICHVVRYLAMHNSHTCSLLHPGISKVAGKDHKVLSWISPIFCSVKDMVNVSVGLCSIIKTITLFSSSICLHPQIGIGLLVLQQLTPFCEAATADRLLFCKVVTFKNRASLLHPSPASFSFEDPKIRVPLYVGVHVTGMVVLSLNLVGTCRCHRWRRRHYRPHRCLPSVHYLLAGDQVRKDHNQKSHSIVFIMGLAASLSRCCSRQNNNPTASSL